MKLTRALDHVLGSLTKLRLLRAMLSFQGRSWTGRELAGAARVSTAQAARALSDLADVGVVLREVRGRSYSWEVNPDHVLFAPLSALFHREAGLRTELMRQVTLALGSAPIEQARLFGSFARGDERSDSDVDLFLRIRTAAYGVRIADAIGRVRARIWTRFGNPVTALVYTNAEAKRPPNPGLMASIDREGIELSERVRRTDATD